jgi:hypothetical protein
MESIPPAYVAWRAGMSNRVVVPACQARNRFLGSLKGLQIRALEAEATPCEVIFAICKVYLIFLLWKTRMVASA